MEPMVGHLARVIAEVYCGARPVSQLRTALAPVALTRFAATLPRGARPRTPIRRVSSVRISPGSPGSLEACAVVGGTGRSHAVALQLRRLQGRWIATAVEMR
jgi:hypothetical protein